jgi:segregation and condensation protein B
LKTLNERGLVEVTARGEGLGRPLLYGTTAKFLEHFGFRSLEDLPRPEELPVVLRTRAPAPMAPADAPDPTDARVGESPEGALPESNGAHAPSAEEVLVAENGAGWTDPATD